MRGNAFSEEEIALMISLRDKGYSNGRVADRMAAMGYDRTRKQVGDALRKRGVTYKTAEGRGIRWTAQETAAAIEAHKAGQSFEAIAQSVGKTEVAVRRFLARQGVYVAPKVTGEASRDPRLLELYKSGASFSEIGKVLGITAGAANGRISRAVKQGLVERRPVAPKKAVVRVVSTRTVSKEQREAAARAAAEAKEARELRRALSASLWEITEASRPFLEREAGQCRWPLGDKGSYHACCKPASEEYSYCREHRLIAGGYKKAAPAPVHRVALPYMDREMAA